mmetsp:Transcript_13608/g.42963  ORF Transcript_13608/g.42963 Transcript_13608/m.42963 type:complete len:238 (-) Transcript_13608:21-734(-)
MTLEVNGSAVAAGDGLKKGDEFFCEILSAMPRGGPEHLEVPVAAIVGRDVHVALPERGFEDSSSEDDGLVETLELAGVGVLERRADDEERSQEAEEGGDLVVRAGVRRKGEHRGLEGPLPRPARVVDDAEPTAGVAPEDEAVSAVVRDALAVDLAQRRRAPRARQVTEHPAEEPFRAHFRIPDEARREQFHHRLFVPVLQRDHIGVLRDVLRCGPHFDLCRVLEPADALAPDHRPRL